MSSDDDATTLMAAFRKRGATRSGASASKSASGTPAPRRSTPRPSPARREPPKKRAFLSESSSGEYVNAESPPKVRRLLHVRPKPIANKDEYVYYEPKEEVESIVKESTKRGNEIAYVVRLVGGETKEVSEAVATQQVREGARQLAAGGKSSNTICHFRAVHNPAASPDSPTLNHDLFAHH